MTVQRFSTMMITARDELTATAFVCPRHDSELSKSLSLARKTFQAPPIAGTLTLIAPTAPVLASAAATYPRALEALPTLKSP